MRFVLVCLLLSLFSACSLTPSRVKTSSIGSTGCPRERLLVYRFDDQQRTWGAVCDDQVFTCSSSGRRASSCSPQVGAQPDPKLLARAARIVALAPERAA